MTEFKYWEEYSALQSAKHRILGDYLSAWFPILSSFHGPLWYFDCHAGRGRHKTGDKGSPLIVLEMLQSHTKLSEILDRAPIHIRFIEKNPKNFQILKANLAAFSLPDGIEVKVVPEPYEDVVERASRYFHKTPPGAVLFFVDPFGYDVPMNLMKSLLSIRNCELIITFMTRFIDMAIHDRSKTRNLGRLYGSDRWSRAAMIEDVRSRQDALVGIYLECLGPNFHSIVRMRAKTKLSKYALIHATNGRRGREVMKKTVRKALPGGTFDVLQTSDYATLDLFTGQEDLLELEKELLAAFSATTMRYTKLEDWCLPTMWTFEELRSVIRKLRNDKIVECSGYSGRFSIPSKDPLIKFPKS